MATPVLVSVMCLLAVVGLYYWWARTKPAATQPQQETHS
jgi:hypothetical protein